MKEFSAEYDPKTHSVFIDHNNILKDLAKDFDKALVIKPFQVSVQVSFDKNLAVSDPDALKQAAVKAAKELAQKALDEIRDLNGTIFELQKEERAGNKKAAGEADKKVKAAKKSLDKLCGEYGGQVREAVEIAFKAQSGQKVKARSASRTSFRGLELNEDFFEEKGGKEEEAPPQFDKLAKSLAGTGKELAGLTGDEKKLRGELAGEIGSVQQAIDKERGDKRDFDIREFAKKHSKEAGGLEAAASKYSEFVNDLDKQLYAAADDVAKLKKLADKSKSLSDDKELADELDTYHDALGRIKENVNDKLEAAEKAQRLLKDDYKQGAAWKSLAAELATMKGAAKSGKALEASGKALEKLAKA